MGPGMSHVRDRLEAAVLAAMDRACAAPMRWGHDDCALWCANVLRDVLDYDAAENFRGHYRSQKGSRRVLGQGGLLRALRAAARRHEWNAIDPMLAQAGDVGLAMVIYRGRPSFACVICRAPGWFVGRGEFGVTALPATMVRRAWKVVPHRRAREVVPGARVAMPRVITRPSMVPTSAAAQEPVSTALGLSALLFNTGLFASVGVAAAFGGAVVGIGVSIGLNYAASALLQRGNQPLSGNVNGAPNDPSIRYNTRQPVPSKRIIYGTAQVGGALFFEQVKNPHLYQGLMISAKPITAIRKIWIGTNELSFASIAAGSILTPLAVPGQPDYPGNLQVSIRLGATDQAIDPILAADFTSLDTEFRQRGIATAVLRYDFGTTQDEYTQLWGQTQRPNPIFLVDGIAVPDPRKSGHVLEYDPADLDAVAAAEATWEWSNNAALCQAHYLTQPYGGRIDPRRVDWDKVAEAADWDDQQIGTTEGDLIRRGTIDGLITLNQRPSDVISPMLSANRGFVLESAGRVWVSSSKPRTAVATIHDAILSGGIEYRAAKPKRDMLNRIKVRFVAEDREYQTVDGPVLSRGDLQTTDAEILDGVLDLPFTLDDRRAQMLQKAFLDTSRLGRRLNCVVDVEMLACSADELVGNAVNVSLELFPQFDGLYFVESWGFTDSFGSISLSLSEYDPAIETDWHPEDDQQAFALADLDVS